jgi:hypothetical protein
LTALGDGRLKLQRHQADHFKLGVAAATGNHLSFSQRGAKANRTITLRTGCFTGGFGLVVEESRYWFQFWRVSLGYNETGGTLAADKLLPPVNLMVGSKGIVTFGTENSCHNTHIFRRRFSMRRCR